MKLFGNTVVPVLNRTIWMFLLVVLLVENVYLFVRDTNESVVVPTPKVGTTKHEDSVNTKKVSLIVNTDYPNLICSAQDNEGFRQYLHGNYGVMPDNNEKDHFLVYGKDTSGKMDTNSMFSISRCEVEGDLSRYVTKKVK